MKIEIKRSEIEITLLTAVVALSMILMFKGCVYAKTAPRLAPINTVWEAK